MRNAHDLFRAVAVSGLVLLLTGASIGPQESAWDVLVRFNSEIVDDPSLSAIERKILQVLTPEQADAYGNGVEPETILLPNAESLAEFIRRQESESAAGLVYQPLVPCVIADTRKAVGRLAAGEIRTLFVRGETTDYSEWGGTTAGCRVPGLRGKVLQTNTARALFLGVEITDAEGPGTLKLWPGNDHPEPKAGVLGYGMQTNHATAASIVVSLCDEESLDPCQLGDFKFAAQGSGIHLKLTVLGYYESAVWSRNDAMENPEAEAEAEESGVDEKAGETGWERTEAGALVFTGGDVGIGTATPIARLHVGGAEIPALISQAHTAGGDDNYFEPLYPTLFVRRGSSTRGAAIALGNTAGRFYLWGNPHAFRLYTPSEETAFTLRSGGNVGIGIDKPQERLHVRGGFTMTDELSSKFILRTLLRKPTSYAGGAAHESRVLSFPTPYEATDGQLQRQGLILASPEVWGGETSYLYAFGRKNIRMGTVNDGWRRSEIELYNDNTSMGRILFRTGKWRDPANVPSSETNVRMMIGSGGKIGIGTMNPKEKLVVAGNLGLYGGRLRFYDSDGGLRSDDYYFHKWSGGHDNNALRLVIQDNPGERFEIWGNGCATPDGCSNNLERSHFFQANGKVYHKGNVGIGTTAPTEALEVNGNVKLAGSIVSDGDICIGKCP